jgi:hypothetical protein
MLRRYRTCHPYAEVEGDQDDLESDGENKMRGEMVAEFELNMS